MTNLQALTAEVESVSQFLSANTLEKAIVDAGLVTTDTYSAANKTAIDEGVVQVLNAFLLTSVSEGGFSMSFDRKAVEAKIILSGGTPVTNNKVKNRSFSW